MRTLAATMVLLMVGCGGRGVSADGGAPGDDAATHGDAAGGRDAGLPGVDGSSGRDAAALGDGSVTDAGHSPEVCTGGIDEDGDTRVDCDDDDCFTDAACAAAHVARTLPGLVPCGDVLTRSTMDSATDCATVGTPMGSSYPLVCGGEVTVESTIRFFCGTDHGAAWVMERLVLPRTMTMTGPRTYDLVEYERASVIDWELHVSGASAMSGPIVMPLYDIFGFDAMGRTTATIVSVRAVLPGDAITRLQGLDQIHSLLDLDSPMSIDTHTPMLVGATKFTVPH